MKIKMNTNRWIFVICLPTGLLILGWLVTGIVYLVTH